MLSDRQTVIYVVITAIECVQYHKATPITWKLVYLVRIWGHYKRSFELGGGALMFILRLTPFWNVTWFCEEKTPFDGIFIRFCLIGSTPWCSISFPLFSLRPGLVILFMSTLVWVRGSRYHSFLETIPFWNVTYFFLEKHPFWPLLDTRLPNMLHPQLLLFIYVVFALNGTQSQ